MPRRCEHREGHAPKILVGIEEAGTVLVGVPVLVANRLQINRKTVRAFAGITNALVRTHESAAHRARRETTRPVADSDKRDWPTSRSPADVTDR